MTPMDSKGNTKTTFQLYSHASWSLKCITDQMARVMPHPGQSFPVANLKTQIGYLSPRKSFGTNQNRMTRTRNSNACKRPVTAGAFGPDLAPGDDISLRIGKFSTNDQN